MTFGYNADFASSQHTKFNVLDFAKQLLFQLQFSNVGFGKVWISTIQSWTVILTSIESHNIRRTFYGGIGREESISACATG